MNQEEVGPDQAEQRWYIDLDWYQQNRRSFSTLAQGYLCSKCRKRLKVEEGEVSVSQLLTTIRDCCSREAGFITGEVPVLESIFRIFLANGNQPLELAVLSQHLSKLRGGDPYRTSVKVLSRLLHSEDLIPRQRYEVRRFQNLSEHWKSGQLPG